MGHKQPIRSFFIKKGLLSYSRNGKDDSRTVGEAAASNEFVINQIVAEPLRGDIEQEENGMLSKDVILVNAPAMRATLWLSVIKVKQKEISSSNISLSIKSVTERGRATKIPKSKKILLPKSKTRNM